MLSRAVTVFRKNIPSRKKKRSKAASDTGDTKTNNPIIAGQSDTEDSSSVISESIQSSASLKLSPVDDLVPDLDIDTVGCNTNTTGGNSMKLTTSSDNCQPTSSATASTATCSNIESIDQSSKISSTSRSTQSASQSASTSSHATTNLVIVDDDQDFDLAGYVYDQTGATGKRGEEKDDKINCRVLDRYDDNTMIKCV